MHIMRMARGTTVRIRHDSNLRHHMDDLVGTFGVLKERWGSLSAVIDQMESRQVNMANFLSAVYGEPEEGNQRSVTMHKNRTEAIFRRLINERFRAGRGNISENWNVTGWEAFNAVQGYVQHEGLRRGSPSDMDRVVMSSADATVRMAERIALELAV